MRAHEFVIEKWTKKYKKSINCSSPKGFSQKAHCAGRNKKEGVVEGVDQEFNMQLAKILKQRGYKGPVKLEQLGMKWIEAIGDIVGIDDYIMVQGNDPKYDGWVSYIFGLGKYAYGAEQGYTTGTAKRVEIDTRDEQGVAEDLRKWFKDKWVRFGPDGKIRGDCARGSEKEGKPKCLPKSKAQSLGKKGRAKAAARKRREDPNANRSGKAINVKTK